MADKKKCFVVMGFGVKTDYRTSRALDLDKTYKHIIKPAVEGAGLACIRADEIPHSGTIDVPMYEQLLDADLVVADLSTSNVNAAYELGVRHALRPLRTVVIAEQQFDFPFDVNHIAIMTYRHDGKALDIDIALTFREQLQKQIEAIMAVENPDSPVYTFLKPLNPPARAKVRRAAAPATRGVRAEPAPAEENPAMSPLMDQVEAAKDRGDFIAAKSLLEVVRKMAPRDNYVTQQLALVTYKSKHPDPVAALEEARGILAELDPMESNDGETLGLWGAIHKRHWEISKDPTQLDHAIAAYEKGYQLLNDYYNGINYAYLLNVRGSVVEKTAEAVADFVLAQRVRRNVIQLCDAELERIKEKEETRGERYWIWATKAEAAAGLEDEARARQFFEKAKTLATADWMVDSTNEQIGGLRSLLERSPLAKLAD